MSTDNLDFSRIVATSAVSPSVDPSLNAIEDRIPVEIKYHNGVEKCVQYGNFIDLRSSEDVEFEKGQWKLIDLGVSIKLPQGYWGQMVPRSSTFRNYGLIMANSFGVIDTDYCGEDDHWMACMYATRDCVVHKNDRICQFRIVKDNPIQLIEVSHMMGKNRGGLGSTGKE